MEIVVLGSGQDAGVPQINCQCATCTAAAVAPEQRRTASSVAVIEAGEALLLDTSPDVRHQWRDIGAQVVAIAWTHAHMGHVAGAAQLGREGPDLRIPGIATPQLLRHLQAIAPQLSLAWTPLEAGAWRDVGPFQVAFHSIQHRAEISDTVAIEVKVGESRCLFLPDTDAWDHHVEAAVSQLSNEDVLLFDATFWSAEEVQHRDPKAIPHPYLKDCLPVLAGLANRGVHVVLTHLNHTNPVCNPESKEARMVADAGLLIAHDGMRLHCK